MSSHGHHDTLVVVTGATGYLGAHVVQQAQQAGYRVRGTVRSLDKDKVDFLHHLCPDAAHPVELVKADLLDADCWNSVVKGATYVIHVASPLPSMLSKTAVTEEDLVTTARDGTLNVLRACVAAKTVKRVVVTSSSTTLCDAEFSGEVTEKNWAEEKTSFFYVKSKIVAERAAWNFVENLPDADMIEMVTLQPGAIYGPVLSKTAGSSIDTIANMMKGGMPMIPHLQMPAADVRDVAECHVKALTAHDAAGHRHIVMTKGIWMQDMARILNEEFTPQGYKIPTRRCPYALVWLMSWFNKQMVEVAKRVGIEVEYNITRMRQVLGVNPRDIKDTIVDMGYSLVEGGFVPKKAAYKGPNATKTDQ